MSSAGRSTVDPATIEIEIPGLDGGGSDSDLGIEAPPNANPPPEIE